MSITDAISKYEDENPTMNIYAKQGHKVAFLGQNGRDRELQEALKSLVVGETYTVKRTVVHSYYTDVYLIERPGEVFNSVMFRDAKVTP